MDSSGDVRPPDHLRVLFALGRLSDELRSALLADGDVLSQYSLTATRPLRLSEQIVVSQEALFDAFVKAFRQPKVDLPVELEGKTSLAEVGLQPSGSGYLKVGNHTWEFKNAVLLNPNRDSRTVALRKVTAEVTLGPAQLAELTRLVTQDRISHDDFLDAAKILETAPEHLANKLHGLLDQPKVKLGPEDLVPDDISYWDNIVPPVSQSKAMVEYINNELRVAEKEFATRNKDLMFTWRSRLFGSPESVPHEVMDSWEAGDVESVIRSSLERGGHFVLTGAFELCVRRFKNDDTFVELGSLVLDALVGDIEKLKRHCEAFATGFVLTTSYLAVHEWTRERPVFWRRLAAMAHAELVSQAFWNSPVSTDKIFTWALEQRWREFMLSVKSDMYDEPRWMPEWIAPEYLAADVYGRLGGALASISPLVPPEPWRLAVETLGNWIREKKLGLQTAFPSLLQGALPSASDLVLAGDLRKMMDDHYRQLATELSAESVVRVLQWVETIGVRPESIDDVHAAVLAIRSSAPSLDGVLVKEALSAAARIAVLGKSEKLASAVADALLNFARGSLTVVSATEVVLLLVECSAAKTDRTEAWKSLGVQLEQLAFLLPIGEQSEALAEMVDRLRMLSDEANLVVARAMHSATLAAMAVGGNGPPTPTPAAA
jgi:hypothetical protein